jgi:hypothetical protein
MGTLGRNGKQRQEKTNRFKSSGIVAENVVAAVKCGGQKGFGPGKSATEP